MIKLIGYHDLIPMTIHWIPMVTGSNSCDPAAASVATPVAPGPRVAPRSAARDPVGHRGRGGWRWPEEKSWFHQQNWWFNYTTLVIGNSDGDPLTHTGNWIWWIWATIYATMRGFHVVKMSYLILPHHKNGEVSIAFQPTKNGYGTLPNELYAFQETKNMNCSEKEWMDSKWRLLGKEWDLTRQIWHALNSTWARSSWMKECFFEVITINVMTRFLGIPCAVVVQMVWVAFSQSKFSLNFQTNPNEDSGWFGPSSLNLACATIR